MKNKLMKSIIETGKKSLEYLTGKDIRDYFKKSKKVDEQLYQSNIIMKKVGDAVILYGGRYVIQTLPLVGLIGTITSKGYDALLIGIPVTITGIALTEKYKRETFSKLESDLNLIENQKSQ